MRFPGTIEMLKEWARWAEEHGLDYPSMSPMFGTRALKTPLYGIGYIPPDVVKVDDAVGRIEFAQRDMIIQRYQRHLSLRKLAKYFDCSVWDASKRLERSELAVHSELTKGEISAEKDGIPPPILHRRGAP